MFVADDCETLGGGANFHRGASHARVCLLLLGLALVLGAACYWFLFGSRLTQESAPRILCGAVVLFMLPGLLLGELLRFRSRHVLETVAIAFLLTQAVQMVTLPVPFLLHARISLWIGIQLALSSALLCGLVMRLRRNPRVYFLRPLIKFRLSSLGDSVAAVLTVAIPLALGVFLYRSGEAIGDISGEKLLHMAFIRNYSSLPLAVADLGIAPNYPPPNLVNLWEFLIAAWGECIRVDPLIVFFRARFVTPVIGLSCMYLFIQAVFVDRRRATAAFLGLCLMCAGSFLLRSPGMAWITVSDPSRGVFAFAGTVHHADPAMDILLPAAVATALLAIQRTRWRSLLLFMTALAATFVWHPREYLQVALYLGIFPVPVLLVRFLPKAALLKGWAIVVGFLLTTAAAMLLLSLCFSGTKTHGYDEIAIKRRALEYATRSDSVLGFRQFFNFPQHFVLSSTLSPEKLIDWDTLREEYLDTGWQLDHWLLLSAMGATLMALLGNRRAQTFAVYYTALWGISLCWNFSMLLILALTYSEFFMSTPRLLYVFSYVAIAGGIGAFIESVHGVVSSRLGRRPALSARGGAIGSASFRGAASSGQIIVLMLTLGVVYAWWHRNGTPAALSVGKLLTYVLLGACALAICRLSFGPRAYHGGTQKATILGQVAFFVPFIALHWFEGPPWQQYVRREPVPWFEEENPFGLSNQLIAWTQSLPAKQHLLVPPGDGVTVGEMDALSLYAPQHSYIFPCTVLLKDLPERARIAGGTHPLMVSPASAWAGRSEPPGGHEAAKEWLGDCEIDYVLINREYYGSYLHTYVLQHNEDYSIVFHNPEQKELVVQCHCTSARKHPAATTARAEGGASRR